MRKNKLKLNNNGFTLSEMIVSMLLLSILLVVVGSIFSVGQNFYVNAEGKNSSKLIGDGITKFISEQLAFAGKIQVLPKGSTNLKYEEHFKINSNNYLVYSGNDAYNDDFYANTHLQYTVKILNNSAIDLNVSILDKDNQILYTNVETISLINVKVTNAMIETTDTQTQYVNPVISFEKTLGNTSGNIEIPEFNMRNLMLSIYASTKKSNDRIRADMLENYYGGAWPTLTYRGAVLHVMPYMNSAILGTSGYTSADIECIIYARTQLIAGWYGPTLIYDHYKNRWMVPTREFSFANYPLSTYRSWFDDPMYLIPAIFD